MKKLFVLFLCVVLCLCGSITPLASSGEDVTVTISTVFNAKPNQEIALTVTLSEVAFSYAVIEIVDLIYNSEVLSFVSCEEGDFKGLYQVSDSDIAFITTTASKNNKGGLFATLYFKTLCDIEEFTSVDIVTEIITYDDNALVNNSVANVTVIPGGVDVNKSIGDVNDDGRVTSFDALLALRSSVNKLELHQKSAVAADVNFDGTVTANDALAILQYSVGILSSFNG